MTGGDGGTEREGETERGRQRERDRQREGERERETEREAERSLVICADWREPHTNVPLTRTSNHAVRLALVSFSSCE